MRTRAKPATDPHAWCVPGVNALHKPRGSRFGLCVVVVQRGGGDLTTVRFPVGGTTIVRTGDLYPNPLQLAPREPAA